MGKVVFITGGTTGIGKAIAEKFSKNGYNLALNYLFGEEEAEAVKKEFEAYGVKVLLLYGDIRDSKVVAEMIDKTVAEFSSIDVLVNNAGITRDGLLQLQVRFLLLQHLLRLQSI